MPEVFALYFKMYIRILDMAKMNVQSLLHRPKRVMYGEPLFMFPESPDLAINSQSYSVFGPSLSFFSYK